LDGKEVLPEASCKKCEGKTGGVEQYLFGDHGHYRAARAVAGSNSRDRGKKTVPLYISLTFEKGRPTGGRRVDLPSDQAGPRFVALVVMGERPAVLRGIRDLSTEEAFPDVSLFFTDLARPDSKPSSYGLPSFSPPGLDLVRFLKFLAKVAHAHATAELGLGGFQPLLTDLIRGKDKPIPWGLFGHHKEAFFPGGNWRGSYFVRHSIQTVSGVEYVVVDICILADLLPRYRVVAGIVNGTKDEIGEAEKVL